MSEDSYFRPDLDIAIPPHLAAIRDDAAREWQWLAFVERANTPEPVTLGLGPAEGCSPPLLHTYRREDGERCQCGEREWPAELRDEEPSAAPGG